MIILASTADLVRVVTSHAALVEVHASYVDLNGTTVTPGRLNTMISTATTTTVVASPASSTVRNIKHLNITNDHASQSCIVTVEHSDGTTIIELMSFTLLPGENMILNEEGRLAHRDAQGAEYPPAGLGAYSGYPVPFMKSGTAADTAGYWYCTSKDAGFPGAWTPGTPGVNGRVTDGTQSADYGSIPVKNPAVGGNFLTEIQWAASVNHTHLLFDVLWVNSGLSVTSTSTAQAITTPTLPARDVNGTTNGEDCMIGILFSAASTLAAVNALSTVSYTNSKGVSGRTATMTAVQGSQLPATPVIGTIAWYNLAAGDTGVQSIQSFNIGATSWLTGTIHLFIARDIATMGTTIVNVAAQKVLGSPGIRLYNGSCILHCYVASATTATFQNGELTIMEK